MAYTTAQLLTALLTVDGRTVEGGAVELPPNARLLLDVIVQGAGVGDTPTAAEVAQVINTLDSGARAAVVDAITATDANAASALRVQQDARLATSYGRVYTPEQFGAVGDYDPVNNVGTDDTAAIQAAANAAVANGRTLSFMDKHYRITDTITFTDPGALTVVGHKSGVMGGIGNIKGSWLHYTGAIQKPMVKIASGQNILWTGVGLQGRSIGDGILITSDNVPVAFSHAYRDFSIYRCRQGIYLNDSGANTQSDQMIFDSVRMDEIVNTCFRANSTNVTGIKFLRCSTFMANSDTDTVQYLFERAAMISLDTCIGGLGQDFIRTISANVVNITIDNSQSEGSGHISPAFLRLGAVGEGGVADTTTIRNCIPDGPVIVNGQSRRLLSIGNKWNPAASITLAGADTRLISMMDTPSLPVTLTGANARFTRVGEDVNGVPTAGQHYKGEMLWDALAFDKGALGWVCTASGTPGTWLPLGPRATGGTTPTGATGTGTTGIVISGSPYIGQVTFITAAGLAVDAEALAVVLASGGPDLTAGARFMLTPANAAAAAAGVYVGGVFTSQFGINLHTPPAGATTMKFNYQVLF